MIRVCVIDAFTREPFGGNRAGVVYWADSLADAIVRRLPSEIASSETVFVYRPVGGSPRFRFLTPTGVEVDACGHGTVAALHALHEVGLVREGLLRISTNAGELVASVGGDPTYAIRMAETGVRPLEVERVRVARALGVDPSEVEHSLPIARVSVGIPWLMVPLRSVEAVLSARPKMEDVRALSVDLGSVGIYAFSGSGEFVSRAFAPAIGVDEDPVTGTGAACLAAYANSYMRLEAVEVRQGHAFGRVGVVRAWIDEGGRAWIGGEAVTVVRGELAAEPSGARRVA